MDVCAPWLGRLDWLECHSITQKVAGSIPISGHVRETTDRCFSLTSMFLSLFLSLPRPPPKINKHVCGWGFKKGLRCRHQPWVFQSAFCPFSGWECTLAKIQRIALEFSTRTVTPLPWTRHSLWLGHVCVKSMPAFYCGPATEVETMELALVAHGSSER